MINRRLFLGLSLSLLSGCNCITKKKKSAELKIARKIYKESINQNIDMSTLEIFYLDCDSIPPNTIAYTGFIYPNMTSTKYITLDSKLDIKLIIQYVKEII